MPIITVQTNFSDVARQLASTRANLPRALEAGLDAAAQVVFNAKTREINRTYARPIPRRKNGKPYWTRSGDWLRGQQINKGVLMREILTANRASNYEGRLANLPNSPIDGKNRTNAAAPEALRKTSPVQVDAVFRQAVANILGAS